jgi:hypothetical protein
MTTDDIIEMCAQAVEPKSPRPCDCEGCYCGNKGDAAAVDFWDAESNAADAIRALKGTVDGIVCEREADCWIDRADGSMHWGRAPGRFPLYRAKQEPTK